MLLDQFERAPILAPDSFNPVARAVSRALRRRDSTVAEAICMLLAIVSIVVMFSMITSSAVSTWTIQLSADERHLTLAGWWAILVSNVIFFFLLFRWLWCHLVWGLLLHDHAKLELRLVANHPDGRVGLAFIGQYPNTYVTYILAVSFVIGANTGSRNRHDDLWLYHDRLVDRRTGAVRDSADGFSKATDEP